MRRLLECACAALILASSATIARAQGPQPAAALVDRVVVRWSSPETGGLAKPQFIFERELAFEARLESLADPDPEPGPYHDRHVRAALDRHIAEAMLAALPTLPPPDEKQIAARAAAERAELERRVQGRPKLLEAAAAEGISAEEIDAMLRRQARASLYLDRMVAPMLEPSEQLLRDLWRTGETPFKDQPYDAIAIKLKDWYVGQKLAQAREAFFQNARIRVVINVARRSR